MALIYILLFPVFKIGSFPTIASPISGLQLPPPSPLLVVITNTNFAIDGAHLIPERAWYVDNNMSKYGVGLSDIDNKANILTLRKDIHHCFAKRWFIIVRKMTKVETGSATPSIRYGTHIISRQATGLCSIYDNTFVESIYNPSRAHLFARFAWAILFWAKLCVINGCPRYVIRIHKDEEGKVEYKAEDCTGKMLISEYGGGGSQAAP